MLVLDLKSLPKMQCRIFQESKPPAYTKKTACVSAAFDRSAEQQQKAFGSTNQVVSGAQEPAGKLKNFVGVSRNHQVVLLNDSGACHHCLPGNIVLLQKPAN